MYQCDAQNTLYDAALQAPQQIGIGGRNTEPEINCLLLRYNFVLFGRCALKGPLQK